ncbi:MAG: HYR domain-containing protein [Bacteroidota bacterium]
MSSKLKCSTFSQGWGLTYVCQPRTNAEGISSALKGGRIGRWSSLLFSLLLTVCFFTTAVGQCVLTCDDQKQISIGTNGYAVIIPELVLNGDFSCARPITVVVLDDQDREIGDTVRCEHVNQTFRVRVSSASLEASCWSSITVEDKLAPRIFCRDTTITCSTSTSPNTLGYPSITDNCQNVDSTDLRFFDLFTELDCGTMHNGQEVGGRITRSWTALDDNGNVGTCTQNIYLLKENVTNVVFPQHRDDVNAPAISCTNNGIDEVMVTGEPTINGVPLRNGDACKMFVAFQDQTVDICPPASYRIIRRWEITDLCTQEVNVGIQNILIVDRDAPTINCPDSFSVVASVANCFATVFLPQATAKDSCSDFTIQPSWEFGTGYGPFTDVPVGTHTITYTATDQCGNSAMCTTKVTVVDESQPVAICRDELNIALTNDGFAEINALVFDGGSRDNCGIVRWEVARGFDPVFGDSIRFTCADVGEVVEIRLRVYDAAGLTSTCTANVIINDETRPVFTDCPSDVTLDCSQNSDDTFLTGYPSATDNCAVREIYFEDEENVNECNIGTVNRTWFAVDSSDNVATCLQRITLIDNTPISVEFPTDYFTSECGADLSPVITGEPVVTGADCENILVSHRDEVFLVGDSACLKILRVWTVLDWCSFDPTDTLNGAKIVATQLIKVTDETPPIITCPMDVTVGITEDACEMRVDLPDLVATDCNPNLTISNTSIYADVNGANASGIYPIGVHTIRYVVSDGCGNLSSCEMTLTVEDAFAPTPVCRLGLTVPLTAGGFVTIPANIVVSAGYDNCSSPDELIYEVSPNYFTCQDIGEQTINVIVTDQSGNAQFCTTSIFIQDNSGVCSGTAPRTAIGGRIFTEDGESMEEVAVQISGGLEQMGYTDTDGAYLFEGLSQQETYTVRPMPSDNFREGISTFDLVLIRKHILGIDPLSSPYKILAADVNNSGAISAYDMVLIRQVVLGSKNDFPNNTSWRYIDASYDFPDPRNPFLESVPEFRDYKKLLINDLERNFIGVKVGDVNNSASPTAMVGQSRSSGETLKFELADLELTTGFTYKIPFTIKDLSAIQGYQFTVDFDENRLQFKEVVANESVHMSQGNFGLGQTVRGQLTTSWENTISVATTKETILFTLVFEAQQSTKLSEVITISSGITKAEAYNTQDELMDVTLQFSEDKISKKTTLLQNRPNPFREQTTISFHLPASTEGSISIFDLNGKLLKSYYGKYAQGYNEVVVDLSEIHTQTGVLYYHLQTPVSKRLSKKMVLIRE